jgi:hypothetical protein
MIALLLTACTTTVRFPPDLWVWEDTAFDTGRRDTAEPGTPPGDPAMLDDASLQAGCNGAATALTAEVRTVGWAGSATLELVSVDRIEVHPMLLMDADPSGAWDHYQAGPLGVGVDPTSQQASVNSAFTCDTALTWLIRTTDRLDAPADCLVWGHDPDDALARLDGQPGHDGLTCRVRVP